MSNAKENVEKWVKALRSGDYKQGQFNLNKDGKFCCLGVACELFKDELKLEVTVIRVGRANYGATKYNGVASDLPEEVMNYLGLKSPYGNFRGGSLAALNDVGTSFNEIADLIESKPKGLFV